MNTTSRLIGAATIAVLAAAYSAGTARAATTPGIARIAVPAGNYQMAPGPHAMWAIRTDTGRKTLILRIDPATDHVTRVATLPFSSSGFTFHFGSLWIADYFGNAVWRVSRSGEVQQQIPVGLQPGTVHAAYGSIWVANHHGQSLSRIDPKTNQVIATDSAGDPTMFRSGPQGITAGAGRLFVGSSNLPSLQWIDPASNLTTTTAAATDDVFCGPLTWAGNHVWSPDNCTNALYQYDTDGNVTWSHTYGPTSGSDVRQICGSDQLAGQLWVAVDRHFDEDTLSGHGAFLQRLDPVTGAVLDRVWVGGDASPGVFAGHGSLWVPDAAHARISRVTP